MVNKYNIGDKAHLRVLTKFNGIIHYGAEIVEVDIMAEGNAGYDFFVRYIHPDTQETSYCLAQESTLLKAEERLTKDKEWKKNFI